MDPITTPAICGYQEKVCPNDYTSCCPIDRRRARVNHGDVRGKKNKNKSRRGTIRDQKQQKSRNNKRKPKAKQRCRGKKQCH